MRLLALLPLAACCTPVLPPKCLPVAEIITARGNRATATHLGGGLWLTNMHVLGDDAQAQLCGTHVDIVRQQEGNETSVSGDWVVFSTEPLVPAPTLGTDFTSEIPGGADVWVVGFGSANEDRAHYSNVLLAQVRTNDYEAANVVPLLLRADHDAAYCGMSGGAVIYNNTVVAIVSGRARYSSGDVRQLAVRPRQR